MPVYTELWGQCIGLDGVSQLCRPSYFPQKILYDKKRRRNLRVHCSFVPRFSLALWQSLCVPPSFEGDLEFGLPWVAGSAEAAAAAAAVLPASFADIAGSAAAGTLGTGPSVLETMLGCKGTGFPCRTLVAGSPQGSVGCSKEKSQA